MRTYSDEAYSVGKWEQLRKARPELCLPHSQTIIKTFSSWNSAKEAAGLLTFSQSRPLDYSKEQLIAILEEHGHIYTSATEWDRYARENDLPSSNILMRNLDEEEKSTLLHSTKFVFSKEKLGKMLLENFPTSPPSATEWESVRNTSNPKLPSTSVFVSRYGSWNNALTENYQGQTNTSEKTYFSSDELISIMKKYYPYHAPSRSEWTKLKKSTTDESLPSSTPYITHFGSWKKAMDIIYSLAPNEAEKDL